MPKTIEYFMQDYYHGPRNGCLKLTEEELAKVGTQQCFGGNGGGGGGGGPRIMHNSYKKIDLRLYYIQLQILSYIATHFGVNFHEDLTKDHKSTEAQLLIYDFLNQLNCDFGKATYKYTNDIHKAALAEYSTLCRVPIFHDFKTITFSLDFLEQSIFHPEGLLQKLFKLSPPLNHTLGYLQEEIFFLYTVRHYVDFFETEIFLQAQIPQDYKKVSSRIKEIAKRIHFLPCAIIYPRIKDNETLIEALINPESIFYDAEVAEYIQQAILKPEPKAESNFYSRYCGVFSIIAPIYAIYRLPTVSVQLGFLATYAATTFIFSKNKALEVIANTLLCAASTIEKDYVGAAIVGIGTIAALYNAYHTPIASGRSRE